MVRMSMAPQNSDIAILTPLDDGIRRWGFGRRVGHVGGTHECDQCLTNKAPERSLTPSTMQGCSEKSAGWKRALTRPCSHPGLRASRSVKNKFLLFVSYPICGTLSQHRKQAKPLRHRGYRAAPAQCPQILDRGVRSPSRGSTLKSPHNRLKR